MVQDEAEHYARDRLALIGDAAHSLNYFGLHGENIGLIDATILANTLIKAKRQGQDLGSYKQVL